MRRLLLFNIFQPIGFPVVNLNRVNRNDSAIFRGLGFSEFRAALHVGLVEFTVQITYQCWCIVLCISAHPRLRLRPEMRWASLSICYYEQ